MHPAVRSPSGLLTNYCLREPMLVSFEFFHRLVNYNVCISAKFRQALHKLVSQMRTRPVRPSLPVNFKSPIKCVLKLPTGGAVNPSFIFHFNCLSCPMVFHYE